MKYRGLVLYDNNQIICRIYYIVHVFEHSKC